MTVEQYPQVTPVNFNGTSVLLTETEHVEDWVPEADFWNKMKDANGFRFECAMATVLARFEASVAPEPTEE